MCLEICYNFWNLLSTWLFLLIYMMSTAENNDDNVTGNNNMSIINSNSHVNSISDNSHDYLSFDMYFLSNYMNNQIIYYFISDAISVTEQACFQQLMKQHKISLELLRWDNTHSSNKNYNVVFKEETLIFVNSDFDCLLLI